MRSSHYSNALTRRKYAQPSRQIMNYAKIQYAAYVDIKISEAQPTTWQVNV